MKFIAFDLETTGINPKEDRIVEVGAVRFDGDRPLDSFNRLVNPGCPIPPEASEVNKIYDHMVQDQPGIQEVLIEFADFCRDSLLVAYNASFDFKFLLEAVEQYKSPSPQGDVFDAYPLARVVYSGLPNYRLSTVIHHLGSQQEPIQQVIDDSTLHRAEDDSKLCGMVFARAIDILQQRGEPCDVEGLVRLTGRPTLRFPQTEQLDLF